MANYKPTTEQILQKAKEIKIFLATQQYRDFIGQNDIVSDSSPYRSGEQTFGDSIELLKEAVARIIQNIVLVDKIDNGMKSNFINYLNSVHSWLISNPIGNWNNILSYSNALYQWVYQWGIYVTEQAISKKALRNLEQIEIKDEEISSLRELRLSLEEVVKAGKVVNDAKKLIDYAEREHPVSSIDLYIKGAKEDINSTLALAQSAVDSANEAFDQLKVDTEGKISNILGKTSDAKTTIHFKEVRDSYREEITGSRSKDDKWFVRSIKWVFTGWSRYLFWSVILFVANLLLVIYFSDKLSVSAESFKIEYVRLIANGIIRMTCLSPSFILLGFVFNGYYSARRMMRIYEEREVVSRTADGHIALLQERKIDNKVIDSIVQNMYGVMYEGIEKKSSKDTEDDKETGFIVVDRALDLVEKFGKVAKTE